MGTLLSIMLVAGAIMFVYMGLSEIYQDIAANRKASLKHGK